MTTTAAQRAATTGIPTPTASPGQLRWSANDINDVANRLSRVGWTAEEVADFLDVLAFQGVRRIAAYVARMSIDDLTAWRSELPSYMADVLEHNASWIGGLKHLGRAKAAH